MKPGVPRRIGTNPRFARRVTSPASRVSYVRIAAYIAESPPLVGCSDPSPLLGRHQAWRAPNPSGSDVATDPSSEPASRRAKPRVGSYVERPPHDVGERLGNRVELLR